MLRLLAPAASHSQGSLKNDTAFFISTKKKKQAARGIELLSFSYLAFPLQILPAFLV